MTNATYQSLTFLSVLKKINDNAFANCQIETLTLPDTVEKFGGHAFDNCASLTTANLPLNLQVYGDAPFAGCSALTTFTLSDDNENFEVINGMLYNKKNEGNANNFVKTLYACPAGYDTNPVTIEPDTKAIGAEAFAYTSNITAIILPQGLTTVNAGAFHASALQTILIPHSVTFFGKDAFNGCRNVTDITILTEQPVTYDIASETPSWNSFWNSNYETMTLHVSDDADYSGLRDNFASKKGSGNDKGWGDLGTITGDIRHRAITESVNSVSLTDEGLGTTNPTYDNTMVNQAYDYVTLYRDFTDTNTSYYMLSLPFAMTGAQVASTFGSATRIYEFAGRRDRTLHFAQVSLTDHADETVISAGTAVIFNPEYKRTSYLIDLTDTTPTAEAVDDTHLIGASPAVKTTTGNTSYGTDGSELTDLDFNYSFVGTYRKTAPVPQYSYYVGGDGTVYRITKTGRTFSKAFRGYIQSNTPEVTPVGAKQMIEIAGISTDISESRLEGLEDLSVHPVYNLQGQRVGSSDALDRLPRGVYVVKGRKIAIQ